MFSGYLILHKIQTQLNGLSNLVQEIYHYQEHIMQPALLDKIVCSSSEVTTLQTQGSMMLSISKLLISNGSSHQIKSQLESPRTHGQKSEHPNQEPITQPHSIKARSTFLVVMEESITKEPLSTMFMNLILKMNSSGIKW